MKYRTSTVFHFAETGTGRHMGDDIKNYISEDQELFVQRQAFKLRSNKQPDFRYNSYGIFKWD